MNFTRHIEEYSVLGIDWTFEGKKRPKKVTEKMDDSNVALLHLTTHRGVCAIINLCKLREIPQQIKVN